MVDKPVIAEIGILCRYRHNVPSGIVQGFDTFRREFITWQIGHDALVCRIADRETHNTEGQLICIITSIFNVIESCCLIHKAYVTICADACQNFFRMAPDQCDSDINIERFLIWKIKIADQSFEMDILGTEQEILSLFHNMCHVVIRAIAAVTDIDIFSSV